MERAKKQNTDGKIGAGKFFAWQTRGASAAVNFIILSFVTIYCTDALKMNPAVVGGLLAGSKIIDAITDLFAGYLVDKTNTRWGKGRPYEWCIVIEWILTILMYAIPPRSFLRREGCLAAGNLCTDQQCMYHTSECCPEPVYDPRF